MLIDQFDFDLPKRLIAQKPAFPRDHAQMLAYNTSSQRIDWGHFYDLPSFLKEGDVLVFNNSKVTPSRLIFREGGKELEVFLLEKVGLLWKALIRPGKRFLVGTELILGGVKFKVDSIDDSGFRYLKIDLNDQEMVSFLEKFGQMPVPPYIDGKKYQQSDYNTVYSAESGSVAAPTAGLHFTDELLARLRSKGIKLEFVTLHVGLGTFLPVKAKDTKFHQMHEEKYQISFQTAVNLNKYLEEGRRIIAVGTTSVRVLEDNFGKFNEIRAGYFKTRILIEPGYRWRVINGLITNFHLPKSTLLLLVSALIGKEKVIDLYQKAIHRNLKFFSFGDGMLLL